MGRFKIDTIKISILINFFLLCVLLILYIIQFTTDAHIFPQAPANALGLFLTVLALASSTFLYLLLRLRITEPAAQLKSAQHSLIHNALKRFNIAVSELARGNITIKLENINIRRLPTVKDGDLAELTEQYNEIANSILDCINDYNSITSIPCRRLFYVGADSFLEGEMCGEILGNRLGGEGEVAILLHSLARSAQSIRKKGFTSVLAAKYPAIEIVDVREEYEDYKKTYDCTQELIKKYPDLKGIYIMEGTTPSMAAKAVKDAGKEADIKIVAHDLTGETIRYLKQGIICASLSQNPFMQGYNPAICLYNYLANKEIPAATRILTHLEEVNTGNYQHYWDPQSGEIISDKARQSLVKPLKNSRNEKFKIAIILPDNKDFWEPVYKGAKEAALLLKEYSATVDVVISKRIQNADSSVGVFLDFLKDLISKQYHAVALPLFDQGLIPYINQYIESGTAFATFNAEPLSFRGMFTALFNNTLHLSRASEDLAAATTQLGQAANKISDTMNLINDSVSHQANQLTETEQQIGLLFAYVTNVTEKSAQSYASADKTQASAAKGSDVVDNSNQAMAGTLESTQMATEKMSKLSENALKIQDIVALINDIAVRTNLIAINASILAARAGKEGREFTVVANEIIALADKSEHSSQEIKSNIDTILANIREATQIIAEGMNDINKSSQLTQTARDMLAAILTASTQNKTNIEDIVNEINKMKSASENVRSAMIILDEINNKNTGAIAEVTGSIREISNQVSEDSKVALTLNEIAQSQRDLLAQFFFEDEH